MIVVERKVNKRDSPSNESEYEYSMLLCAQNMPMGKNRYHEGGRGMKRRRRGKCSPTETTYILSLYVEIPRNTPKMASGPCTANK